MLREHRDRSKTKRLVLIRSVRGSSLIRSVRGSRLIRSVRGPRLIRYVRGPRLIRSVRGPRSFALVLLFSRAARIPCLLPEL